MSLSETPSSATRPDAGRAHPVRAVLTTILLTAAALVVAVADWRDLPHPQPRAMLEVVLASVTDTLQALGAPHPAGMALALVVVPALAVGGVLVLLVVTAGGPADDTTLAPRDGQDAR